LKELSRLSIRRNEVKHESNCEKNEIGKKIQQSKMTSKMKNMIPDGWPGRI